MDRIGLTSAQRRALRAVAAGVVFRQYQSTGKKIYHAPRGIGGGALYALERLGLITDTRERVGRWFVVRATASAKQYLEKQ